MNNDFPHLSIVIPFFNEQDNLTLLIELITKEVKELNHSYEIILVDDGSSDNSLFIVNHLISIYKTIKCIELSRNFGQENAILAGLTYAKGDVVITMDADLQHPPKYIADLMEKYKEGYDVVNSSRKDKNSSWFKRRMTVLFYIVMNFISGTKIPVSSFNFKLMSRSFLNDFLQLKERNRFERGLVEWLGYKQCCIVYEADKRYSGKSKYSFFKLVYRAINSITSFSTRPLRFVFFTGVTCFLVSLLLVIYLLLFSRLNQTDLFFSVLFTFFFGLLFLIIGILSEYMRSIYDEVKQRPNYVIKQIIETK